MLSKSNVVYVDKLDHVNRIVCVKNPEEILKNVKVLLKGRNLEQFRKYYYNPNMRYWCILNPQDVPLAMCCVSYVEEDGETFIWSLQSFVCGYGKILLKYMIDNNEHVGLDANWADEDLDNLLKYYRDPCFGFKETVYENPLDVKVHHFSTRN